MKKLLFSTLTILSLANFSSQATILTCPDPQSTSLKNGLPPAPWAINPFSSNPVTVDENTQFEKANVLLAGRRGLGVLCFYKNRAGHYSIWWETLVKIPPVQDYNWIDTNGGFICSGTIENCKFSVA
ncbi:MAG: DUF3757 domain-containing protein [Tatlockia sp.]|nr:DUF3757 domain-containing protein [Tatlockia sp.]